VTFTRSGVSRRIYAVCDSRPVLQPATAQVGAELASDEGGEPVAAALIGGAGCGSGLLILDPLAE
jgi:hypothetical protein